MRLLRIGKEENIMENQMVRVAKEFAKDESGVGVVEMILILVVLIGLVIIFKKQLTNLVNSIFETINSKAGSI
jgi:Flp pilus assembly pilin Flp